MMIESATGEPNNNVSYCNCSLLLEILAGSASKTNTAQYTAFLNSNSRTPDNYKYATTASPMSSSVSESESGCVAREYRQMVWNANREIWMEWRQRPEYLANGDLYSIIILCLFASIILLLMVRAIKPNQSVDDQVTLLLNSMRVRVDFENNARQRQKLRDAKLKAIRWLAEAKMRSNMRKLSFRRSHSTTSNTAHSADGYMLEHLSYSAASPTRSLFAGAFNSHCVGGGSSIGKRDSSESGVTKNSTPSPSLISQSLSRAPSIIFPVEPASINKRPPSPAKSLGGSGTPRRRALPPPPLHFSMHSVSAALIAASVTAIAPHHRELTSRLSGFSLDEKLESGLVQRLTRPSPTPSAGSSTSTPIANSAPTISPQYLYASLEEMRRLSFCSSVSSSMVTPRPPSTPGSARTIRSQRSLRQKDSWPFCASGQRSPCQPQFSAVPSALTTAKLSSRRPTDESESFRRNYRPTQYHHERTRSFHFVPQIVVQCDDDDDKEEEAASRSTVSHHHSREDSGLFVDQQKLRRQLQQQLDANDGSGGSPSFTTDDDDDSSRSSSRPFSSSRASSSLDDEATSQSSFS